MEPYKPYKPFLPWKLYEDLWNPVSPIDPVSPVSPMQLHVLSSEFVHWITIVARQLLMCVLQPSPSCMQVSSTVSKHGFGIVVCATCMLDTALKACKQVGEGCKHVSGDVWWLTLSNAGIPTAAQMKALQFTCLCLVSPACRGETIESRRQRRWIWNPLHPL